MKIVMSIRNLAETSGVERVVINLASALCDLGHQVEIACYYKDKHGRVSTFPLDKRIAISYIYPHPDNHTNDKGLRKVIWKWFRHLIVNLRINKQYKDADIFIESDFFLLFPYFKRRGMKYIRIIHVEIAKWKRKNSLFDAVVLLSSSEYERWRNRADNITKIYNFVFLPFESRLKDIIRDSDNSNSALNPYDNLQDFIDSKRLLLTNNIKTHGYNVDSKNNDEYPCATPKSCKIIAVGQMYSEQKGFPRLVSAYSKIAKEFPHCKLEITGKGNEETIMNAQIHSLDMTKYIKLKPFSTNIESVYLQGDIYAMTSYYEGLPMALLEAMSYGLPLIAYEIDTIKDCFAPNPEIRNGISYHKNGILVPNNNETLFCQALKELINNETMRIKMGQQSLILIKNKFSKEVVMRDWQALLESLM
ncbi:glycosyltransferase [Helicobacter sp. MIT 14-3879]|uniref:glycosyltransferase n=1 Tax=Helicobacter sp. MIT 14-3879 TaxID=2040649 RepID=UPI0015F183AB|nr:glycosyltransferase [Helicobacter sp. MIT 14-3879]